jgi:hypothetical protein
MPPQQRSVFIVRIWRESDGGLRGSLQTAPADDLRYFATLTDLLRLLQATVDAPSAEESGGTASQSENCAS